jgi:hypothetical protein
MLATTQVLEIAKRKPGPPLALGAVMRNLVALTILLAGCSAGVSTQTQGLHKQRCVTTITCPDGGVLLQSFDTTTSDSNAFDGGSAVFVPGGGGSSGGGTSGAPGSGTCGPEIYTCYDGGTGGSSSGGTTGGGTTGGGTTGGGTTSGPGMGNGNGTPGGMGKGNGSMGGNTTGGSMGGGLPGGCWQETTCTPEDDSDGGADTSDGGASENGGCWITGGGYIVDTDGNDSFGGNAMPMKDGTVRGQWEEQDHGTNDKAHGEASYIMCRHVDEPGPGQPGGKKGFTANQAYFGGHARWFTPADGWKDGYWFDVMVEDHGEGHGIMDYYHFTIRDAAGTVVYDTQGNQIGGNIQLHPPNAGHPSTGGQLPPWVMLQP